MVVDGIVLRPSIVYGRSGSITGKLFAKAQPGQELQWPGTPGGHWATVHVDDLVKLYVLLGEAVSEGAFFSDCPWTDVSVGGS